MMGRIRGAVACILLTFFSVPVSAKTSGASDSRMIRAGEPLQLSADRAYILLRIDTDDTPLSAVVMRIPSENEIETYMQAKRNAHREAGAKAPPFEAFSFKYRGRSNLYEITSLKWRYRDGKIHYALAEVPPGDYILYGTGVRGGIFQCYCFGTVGFSASAGNVTDLGALFFVKSSKASETPALASLPNLNLSAFINHYFTWLRRPDDREKLPAEFDGVPKIAAKLQAVGTFVDTLPVMASQLPPIPGVLAYDRGRVIDVSSGREVPDN